MNLKKLVLVCGAAGALVGSTLAFGSTYYLATENGPQLATVKTPSSANSRFTCFESADYHRTVDALARLSIPLGDLTNTSVNVLTPYVIQANCFDLDVFNNRNFYVDAAKANSELPAALKGSMTQDVKSAIKSGVSGSTVVLKLSE